MARFAIVSLIAFSAAVPTASAALLKSAVYRISCDPMRPTPIPATAPGRRYLAINSPNANATFSRYVTEKRSPEWNVKKDAGGIEYVIESRSFNHTDLGYKSPAAGGVPARGDNGTTTDPGTSILNRWYLNDAMFTGGGYYFVQPSASAAFWLDCNHGPDPNKPSFNSSPAYLRPNTTINSVIPLYFEKTGDLTDSE